MHFLHKTFPGTSDKITVQIFSALTVLFPDCQKSGFVVLCYLGINFLQPKHSFAQLELYSLQDEYLADSSETTLWYARHVTGIIERSLISLSKKKQTN